MRLICSNYINKISTINRIFSTNTTKLKPPWSVLFFGTDEFSVASLRALNEERLSGTGSIDVLEVVTRPKTNPVRLFARQSNLVIHDWPYHSPEHCHHIGLVVSFGHLIPGEVIDSFPMGMLNVHASLLPRWRGAAPIIYAIASGDATTGVTVMRVRPARFDVGEVVSQEEVGIGDHMRMPELHERLAQVGARSLVAAVRGLPGILDAAKPQSDQGVTLAPRVNASLANVDFHTQLARDVYNLARALTGMFPLATRWNGVPVKLHNVAGFEPQSDLQPGCVAYNKKSKVLKIGCMEGCVLVDSFGVQNKKVMNATEFNNGYVKKQNADCRVFR